MREARLFLAAAHLRRKARRISGSKSTSLAQFFPRGPVASGLAPTAHPRDQRDVVLLAGDMRNSAAVLGHVADAVGPPRPA